jgi:hypothetical protein
MNQLVSKTLVKVAAGTAIAALVAGTMVLAPKKAEANPGYASATGKPCTFCHTAPPNLNANGKKFQANGHKLK